MIDWKPIESAPVDTSKGDFLISCWTAQGDCAWVQLVRNPKNHHGMTIASHWAGLGIPPADCREQSDRYYDHQILGG